MTAIKDALSFKTSFTTAAWVLIPVAIGINMIGRTFTQVLNLPLFLDTIGTTMVAFLAGPWVAAVAGVLTNLVIGLTLEATSIPFGIVNAAIGIVAGVMAARGFLRSTVKVIWLMVALTVTTIITATPIVVLVFEGVSGSGVDAVTGFFVASGQGNGRIGHRPAVAHNTGRQDPHGSPVFRLDKGSSGTLPAPVCPRGRPLLTG